MFEVTMESPDPDLTIEALRAEGFVVGAGTVLDRSAAVAAVKSGAQFIVSPVTEPSVIATAAELNCPMVPGAFTPTEALTAWNLGVSAVKLFPALIGGPAHVKAIKGPLWAIPLMATGGINAGNAAQFLEAGASSLGVGGWLANCDNLADVTKRARELVLVVDIVNV